MPLIGDVSLAATWDRSPLVFSTQLWSYPFPFFICSKSVRLMSYATLLGVVKSIGVSLTEMMSPVVMKVLSTGV